MPDPAAVFECVIKNTGAVSKRYRAGKGLWVMFELKSEYKPTGDQPQAIAKIVDGINQGLKYQTLMGVTGSGKTFTMANIIAAADKPAIVLAHNKTLAAQLCSEFKEFFPNNAVEYFVSYFAESVKKCYFVPICSCFMYVKC